MKTINLYNSKLNSILQKVEKTCLDLSIKFL